MFQSRLKFMKIKSIKVIKRLEIDENEIKYNYLINESN